MIISTQGICLKTTPYSETTVIAQILTREIGLRSYIISGVRTAKPKVHPNVLHPMSLLNLVVYNHPNKTLNRTKEIELAYSPKEILFNLKRSSIALFTAEVLAKSMNEAQHLGDWFNFLVKYIYHLDTCAAGFAHLHNYFLLQYAKVLGFMPDFQQYKENLRFNLKTGDFSTFHSDNDAVISVEATAYILDLMNTDLSTLEELKVPGAISFNTVQSLLLFLQIQTGGFPKVKGHLIFKDVFKI